MNFDSHTSIVVQQAVALVNAMVPGQARGRPYPAAEHAELRSRADSVMAESEGRPMTAEEAAGLADVAAELHTVFAAASAGDLDTAAGKLNELIVRYEAKPTLIRHDGEPWHMHFHPAGMPLVPAAGGGMSVALALVLGGEYADRIGICSAPACDRVYIDTSRNGTKRFCSTACQNRVKAAAFRARHNSQPTPPKHAQHQD